MKKWISLCLLLAVNAGATVPQQITYQGTLKQSGAAANGTFTMTFRLTDSAGLTQYWSSGPMQIAVTQGLFSQALSPTGVDWANVSPFIVVNINGQDLGPPEPITSSAYALECGSMVGMIAMFTNSCPTGWSVFAGLQGRFPVGADGGTFTAGSSGGSLTHTHRLADSPTFPIFGQDGFSAGVAVIGGANADGPLVAAGGGGQTAQLKLSTTDPASSLPPYMTVVYCQKQ